MMQLIMIKDKLKTFYSRFDVVIDYFLKFVFALIAFMVINKMTGYYPKVSGTGIAVALSLICIILPKSITVILGCMLVVVQMYGLSIEFAVITLAVMLIMLCIYFVFSPKTGYILLLVPILFCIKIPYLIPVIVGLTTGLVGIIPVIFGTYIYYVLDFSKEYANTASAFTPDAFIQRINYIIDNTILNKEMMIYCIIFAAVIIIVYVIKRFSMDYSWMVAVGVGSIVQAILIVMSHTMLSVELDMAMLIAGTVLTIVIGLILDFFIFSVDYTRTERVQFEDDDFYYYVKAVPKFNVAKTEVKIKKINTPVEEETERSDDFEEDRKRIAYERDIEEEEEE